MEGMLTYLESCFGDIQTCLPCLSPHVESKPAKTSIVAFALAEIKHKREKKLNRKRKEKERVREKRKMDKGLKKNEGEGKWKQRWERRNHENGMEMQKNNGEEEENGRKKRWKERMKWEKLGWENLNILTWFFYLTYVGVCYVQKHFSSIMDVNAFWRHFENRDPLGSISTLTKWWFFLWENAF